YCNFIGRLFLEDGLMVFEYADSWLADTNAVPLSRSLPLRLERYDHRQCRGFFTGILPEEGKRALIARNLGISATNDFSMLAHLGGECAGAVTLLPEGEELPSQNIGYRSLSDGELVKVLEQLPQRPLMAGDEGVRLS